MQKKFVKFAGSLFILLLSVALCFLLLEIYLRWQPLKANTQRDFQVHNLEYDYPIHLNSDFFRDEEFHLAKAPGTFRILLIGDSYAYGLGTPNENTFDKLLEQKLNANSPALHYEVYNVGIVGADPFEYYQLGQQFKDYHPDLVLVSFYVDNDIHEGSLRNRWKIIKWKEKIQDIISTSLWQKGYLSCMFSWIEPYRGKVDPDLFDKACMGVVNPHLLHRGDMPDQQAHYRSLSKLFQKDPFTQNSLMKLKKLFPESDYLLVMQPSKYQVTNACFTELEKLGFDFPNHELLGREIQDAVRAWAVQNQIDIVDVLPAMLASPDKNFYHCIDDHYKESGNQFVADLIFQHLKDHSVHSKTSAP